jgi:hypothetical protein
MASYTDKALSATNRGISRGLLWSSIATLLTFQGCGFSKLTYLQPTPDDFERARHVGRPFYEDPCNPAPEIIRVPIEGGAIVQLVARQGAFTGKGYSGAPGTTLFGEAYVPFGTKARFVTSTFTVRTGATDQEQQGTVAELTRHVFVLKRRGSAAWKDLETQSLSNGDTLVGWASDEDNLFKFVVPLEGFVAPSFTVRMPDMEVNGRVVPGKSISFKRIEKTHFVSIFEALCS